MHPLPNTADSERLKLRGIIPVDLFGVPADYDSIRAIAAEHSLFVIQDAAQSFGAEYRGRKACAHADVGCTSFFPAKPLGAYGDGGMCFTDSADLAERMRSIRIHGQGSDKYENVRIGINGRLDTLQAAILLEKLQIFPEELHLREEAARRYTKGLGTNTALQPPSVPADYRSAWAQYSLLARSSDHRSELLERLRKASVPSAIYYSKPLHLQQAFASLGYGRGDFPESESCAERVFSIPMHPYLLPDEQQFILEVLAD
jgi:dTDP-4-amino-4,6-dideoxygalactose transaminase